jgi:hypothetical protein
MAPEFKKEVNGMKGSKLVSRVLSGMLAVLVVGFCLAANPGSGRLAGNRAEASGSAGRTIILMIGSPIMFVNDVPQDVDPGYATTPVIVNGRTCLPIKAIIGDAGTVNWDATQQKVTINLNGNTVVLYIGRTTATVNGKTKSLDVAPFISRTGRTMLPLRFIMENFGMTVTWYSAYRTVVISMNTVNPVSSGAITVTAPASGVTWQPGSTYTIAWNYSGLSSSDTVRIDLYQGSTYVEEIDTTDIGSGGYGSYNWTVDSGLGYYTNYRILITDINRSNVSDYSSYFTIGSGSGSITVTAPASGVTWQPGSSYTIAWNYTGLSSSDTVRIDLYQGSNTSENIAVGYDIGSGGYGSYNWTVDSSLAAGANYRIRVIDEDYTSKYAYSSYFTIGSSTPSITVTSPISGANWQTGTTHTITWNYTALSGTVSISLLQGGSQVGSAIKTVNVSSSGSGSGSCSWTVDSSLSPANNYQIQVSNSATGVSATSGNFTISVPTPAITVTSPISGANWQVGTTHTITFTYANLTPGGTVSVDLLQGGSIKENISSVQVNSSGSGSGSCSWTVDSTLNAGTYQIQVSNASATGISSNFTISVPSITVMAPASGAQWSRGQAHTITWSYTALTGTVTINLLEGGNTTRITSGASVGSGGSGSYSWTPSKTSLSPASDYLIQVISNSVANCSSTSGTFSLT